MALLPHRIPLWGYAAAFGASFLVMRAVRGGGLAGQSAATTPTPATATPASGATSSSSGSLWDTFGASGGSQTFPGPDGGSLPAPVPAGNGLGVGPDPSLVSPPPVGIMGGYPGAVPVPGTVTGTAPAPAPAPSPVPSSGSGTTAVKPSPDTVGTNTSWTYWARFAAATRLYRAPTGGTCPLVGAMNSPVGPSVLVTKVAECGSIWWYIVDPSYPALAGYRIRYGDYNAKISP